MALLVFALRSDVEKHWPELFALVDDDLLGFGYCVF